jgi:hypothetical protein
VAGRTKVSGMAIEEAIVIAKVIAVPDFQRLGSSIQSFPPG